MISLSPIDVVDLFFRFAATGLLFLLMFNVNEKQNRAQTLTAQLVILCIVAYVLLTTPIPDKHYGWFRQPLLLLTDLTAYAIFAYAYSQLTNDSVQTPFKLVFFSALFIWCGYLSYFFLFTSGNGRIHDINHVVSLLFLLYAITLCLTGFKDDLVGARRKTRLNVIIGSGVYMTILTVFELALQPIKNNWLFSLINALIIFVITLVFCHVKLHSKQQSKSINKVTYSHKERQNPTLTKLNGTMESGFYREPELTIGKLASELNVPAHQLRLLINQELGFTNFSHYLNSYRIPAICKELQSPELNATPILTLALSMGYGSITSFNRAFKQQMSMTPSQYRNQF